MECDICQRSFSTKRTAVCTSCAQATLYNPRIDHVTALLGREKSHTHVEAILRPGNDGVIAALPEDADWDAITTGIKKNSWEACKVEQQTIEPRIRRITAKAEELRQQVDEYKSYVAKKKAANERRRKELADEWKLMATRKSQAIDPVQTACRRASRQLDKVRARTAEARECLCREAAFLNGLNKFKNVTGRSEYHLNGLIIPDLRDLNGINGRIRGETLVTASGVKPLVEQHELISASLDNICRFLGVCCSYLSVRLPAEILLPHNDFSHAMILQERSSYRFHNLELSGLDTSHASSSSLLRRRKDLPSPRLLQLDRPLAKLQQEDAKTFEYFVEGVMWLAWDIAWLCRTQGIDTINTFEDVCAVGKNLNLLFSAKAWKAQARPSITRNLTSTSKDERPDVADIASDPIRFGMLSHNSAQNSLAGAAGARLREGWKLESSSYSRLFDRLRNYLVDEARKAEWTFIDEREWDEEMEHEKPVLIGGSRRTLYGPAMSVMTIGIHEDSDETNRTVGDKGMNGWMKVRGRAS